MNLIDLIHRQKTMPPLLAENVATTLDDVAIYQEAGHKVVEILLRTPLGLEAIQAARKKFPDMIIGAGTVLTPAEVDQSVKAGAQFIVSPAMDPVVGATVKSHKLLLIPGVYTASDIAIGLREGFHLQKLFPVELAALDTLASPFTHTPLRLIAAYGVSKENFVSTLERRVVGGVIAGWLYNIHGDNLRRELKETLALVRPRAA